MSARTAWNTLGWVAYAGLVGVGAAGVVYSLFFPMATDACPDAACDASHHVWPAMLTMWIGVAAVLLGILVVMTMRAQNGRNIAGWPIVGLAGLTGVFGLAALIL